jgi:hypothetical protein
LPKYALFHHIVGGYVTVVTHYPGKNYVCISWSETLGGAPPSQAALLEAKRRFGDWVLETIAPEFMVLEEDAISILHGWGRAEDFV